MSIQTLEIGGIPAEEQCAQTGSEKYDYDDINRLECRAYIVALTKKFGPPPDGAALAIGANRHDFGTYYDVRIRFDDEDETQIAYAEKVVDGLRTWHEARVWAPCVYDDGGMPRAILRDPKLWDMDANPSRLAALDAQEGLTQDNAKPAD